MASIEKEIKEFNDKISLALRVANIKEKLRNNSNKEVKVKND